MRLGCTHGISGFKYIVNSIKTQRKALNSKMYPVLFHKAPHEEINFSMQNNAIEISCKEICAETPTSAVNVTLPAFAAQRGACSWYAVLAPEAIARSAANPPLPLSIGVRDRRTDRQTRLAVLVQIADRVSEQRTAIGRVRLSARLSPLTFYVNFLQVCGSDHDHSSPATEGHGHELIQNVCT